MARQKASIPTYRKCTIHGNTRAMVTLTDAATGQRQAFYLGEYGTPESREKYVNDLRGQNVPAPTLRSCTIDDGAGCFYSVAIETIQEGTGAAR